MSMLYLQAKEVADKICSQLYPHVETIYIGGSIRRQCSEVKDIEIICIPKTKETGGLTHDLFSDLPTLVSNKKVAIKSFVNTVNQWPSIKGKPTGRYTQRSIPGTYIKLDLFMADNDNLGYILALRTGPADYSIKIVERLKQQGYIPSKGHVYKNGELITIPDEEKLFSLLGWTYKQPHQRKIN